MIERFAQLAALSLLLAAVPAAAQDAPPPAGDAPPRPMMPRTRAQAEATADAMIARLDTNKDGVVTRAEFDALREGAGAPPPPPRPGMGGRMMGMWFERADADHDGRVTAAEAKAAALARFDRMDANHDGTLTPDEMPMRPRG